MPQPKNVSAPEYRKALAVFSNCFQQVHRAAGEPTYDEVGRQLGVSPASVHRYLNGLILPRWQFVAGYLEAFAAELGAVTRATAVPPRDVEGELKDRWMAAREVLKPIQVNAA